MRARAVANLGRDRTHRWLARVDDRARREVLGADRRLGRDARRRLDANNLDHRLTSVLRGEPLAGAV